MRKYAAYIFAVAGALIFSAAAVADSPIGQVSTDDFGQKVINILAWGSYEAVGGEASLLSTLSKFLNAAALSLMAWLAVVGGANFVIQTANKGVPGGQVISSFWMPIRICAATILLVPLTSGYSSIQLGVIGLAGTGSKHANELSKIGLDYIAENGTHRTPLFADNRSALLGWIQAEVCAQYIDSYQSGEHIQRVKRTQSSPAAITVEYSFDQNERPGTLQAANPRRAYCGKLSISMPQPGATIPLTNTVLQDPNSADLLAATSIANDFYLLLDALQPRASKIAQLILSDEHAYRELVRTGTPAQSAFEAANSAIPQKISEAAAEFNRLVADYDSQLNTIVSRAVEKASKEISGASWREEVGAIGWMGTGMLYWQISQHQERINGIAKTLTAYYTAGKIDTDYAGDERFDTLQVRIAGLDKLAKDTPRKATANIISIEMAGGDGTEDLLKKMVAQIGAAVAKAMLYDGANGDLIMSLQYSGSVINTTADLAKHISILGVGATKGIQNSTQYVFNTAATSASSIPFAGAVLGAGTAAAGAIPVGLTTMVATVAEKYNDEIQTMIIPLILAGFMLAVVLPTLPLFIWIMGLISWMLFFIECLLVSPFWMSAHGTAEHEGWGSEHTRQGYMLMIGLYLSPILRTVGFFAIYLALQPLGIWVAWLFSYLQGVIVSGWISPSIVVLTPLLAAIFVYSAAVRIFSLPTELFERGLRWINGGQEVTGDGQAAGHNQTLIAGFGDRATSVARGGAMKAGDAPTPTAIQPNSIAPKPST